MLRLHLCSFFVFLLGTAQALAQAVLTGFNVYYWLVAGFGNVEFLTNSYIGA
jgi:hypothetical protein